MKYYKIFSPDEYWFLYCSKEEIARLQLDVHLLRNRERWKNPKPIQLYVDTNVPDHEQLDFDEPILRNTMLWSSGGGSRKWHKAAFIPFITGMCISDELYKIFKNFNLTNEQFLELEIKNYQKQTTHKYWLFYPIVNYRFIKIKESEFKKIGIKDKSDVEIVLYNDLEEYFDKSEPYMMTHEFKPHIWCVNEPFDFLFDRYNYIVSARLRNAIEEAGMTDVTFYGLDYEVIIKTEN